MDLNDGFDPPDGDYLTLSDFYSGGGIRITNVQRNNDYVDQTFLKQSIPPCNASCEVETQSHDVATLSRDQHLQHAVQGFYDYIVDAIKVTDLIPRLHHFIDGNASAEILNRDCTREAAVCLLDALTKSQVQGRWQAFMDALEAGGYPYLVRLINGHTEKDHSVRKNLLKLYQPRLIDNIHLDTCLDKLFEFYVLHECDVQEIRSERIRRSERAAILKMLDLIPRREENWFESFLQVLRLCDMGYIVEELEDVDIKPPPRCSSPCFNSETPPPGYTEHVSFHSFEIKRNEHKLKRLSKQKEEKQKVLNQRIEIKELRETHKQLDTQLEDVQDDSGSDIDSHSAYEISRNTNVVPISNLNRVFMNSAFSFPRAENVIDARQEHMEHVSEDIESNIQHHSPTESVNSLCNQVDVSSITIDANNKPIGDQYKEQMDVLIKSVENLHEEFRDLKDKFITLNGRVDEGFRQIGDRLNIPPRPHNMHPVDSAFSDGSIISITSL